MARLRPFFPKSHGKPRVDDRWVLSGIRRFQPVVATAPSSARIRNSSSASAGVLQPRGHARPSIQGGSNGVKGLGPVQAEVGALGEVLAEEAVGVFVGAALPGAVRIAEVDGQLCEDLQVSVPRHFCALIPGQRPAEMLGKTDDAARDGVTHRLGLGALLPPAPCPSPHSPFPASPAAFNAAMILAMSGEGGAVLLPGSIAVARHGRQMKQHREARRPLDQGADRGTVQAKDQVTLPVPGNGAIPRPRRGAR